MTTITLGAEAFTLHVSLTTGSDFSFTATYLPDWPVGTTLTIVFGDLDAPTATWTATIAGSDATFAIDKAVADLRPKNEDAWWRYVNGTTDTILAAGKVVRRHG